MNQAIDKRTSGTGWSTKALGACLMVVVALMAACLMMAAQPAHASTTLTVNSTADFHDTISNDGFCGFGGSCSLRSAIEEANSNPGADTIKFAIPGTGLKTIVVNSTGLGALPAKKEQVTIDGYTQTDAHPNTLAVGNDAALKIQLDGTNVGGNALEISNASGSVIKGLVINRFDLAGIFVTGDSVGNRIEGNFIGTNPTGTIDRGNGQDAVTIFAGPSQTVVGGTTRTARNLLSGNGNRGVAILDSDSSRIQGNYVGTDKSGTKDLGNAHAGVLLVGGSDNLVGNGTSAGSNSIAFNGDDGISVSGSTTSGNVISRNSVFSNVGLGIDLVGGVEDAAGRTANDAGDVDAGPNGLQNKPYLGSAKTVLGKTTVKGTLNSAAGKTYKIEFYSNPSGGAEGKKFIGAKVVSTGSDGKAAFTFTPATKVSVGRTVTATATNTTTGSPRDTSEFSAPRRVTST
jgi:CSLREA domain-containing protein